MEASGSPVQSAHAVKIKDRSDTWSHHFKGPFMLGHMESEPFGSAVWIFFGDIFRKFGFL